MEVKWHGGSSEHCTSPKMYYLTDWDRCPEHQREEFRQVVEKLEELSRTAADWEWDPPVQLLASRLEHSAPFIAYRYTSDAAYRTHEKFLVAMGGSLGRGSFTPWSDSWAYQTFVK